MKQLIAIILFTSFLLSNYAKQIRYVQCTITNAVSIGAPCDCLTISKLTITDKAKHFSFSQTNHIQVDETYTCGVDTYNHHHSLAVKYQYNNLFSVKLLQGFSSLTFRPPNV